MASITAILDKIRGNRREAEITADQGYYHLIRDIAAGAEIDAADAAVLIESAGKTDSDFEADVATMSDRLQAAEMLAQRRHAERERSQAEADLQAARAKLEAAVSKLQPAVDEAATRRARLEQQVLSGLTLENRLATTCMDPTILAREAELAQRLAEVRAKLEPIEIDYRRHASWLAAAESNRDILNHSITNADDWNTPRLAGLKIELAKAESRLESEMRWCRELEKLVAPMERERSEIQRQQDALQKQKLIP